MSFRACLRSLGVITLALIGLQFILNGPVHADASKRFVVLGPIVAHDAKGMPDLEEFRECSFDADLLAEVGGETAIKAREGAVVKLGSKQYRWTPAVASDFVVDLNKTLGPHVWSVAYAYTEVDSEAERQLVLGLGSDDSVRVWLNGELVHSRWAARPLIVDQDLVPVTLRKGTNRLLVKVVNWSPGSSFSCRPVPDSVLASTLARAVYRGDYQSLEMLLGHGISPNQQTELGIKPIQVARIFGDNVMAKMLLDAGAEDLAPPADPTVVTNAVFQDASFNHVPGLCVLVARDGKVVFQGALGLADVESGRKLDIESKFRIGSVTMQFTAAAILKLVEEGKISLNDTLDKYLPDFPRAAEVTIDQLLSHTSGIPNYTDDPSFHATAAQPTTEVAMIAKIAGQKFNFEPGTGFRFNNSGYFLLGHIIGKVTRKSLGEYFDQTFFKPLAMNDTGMHRVGIELENEALGHAVRGETVTRAMDWAMSRAGGAGGLYSTVGDLMKWNEAVFTGKVLKEDTLRDAFTAVEASQRKKYGYGCMIGRQRGLHVISHRGGLNGFQSNVARFPEQNVTIVALHNASPAIPDLKPIIITAHLADLFLWQEMEPRETFEVDSTVSPDVFARYVGHYDYGGPIMSITQVDDQLFAQLTGQPRFEIFPATATRFFCRDVEANVEFLLDDKGNCVGVHHRQGAVEFEAPRLPDQPRLTLPDLDQFLGVYDYQPAKMRIARQGVQLVAQFGDEQALPIYPVEDDLFVWKATNAKIKFVRDKTGRVIGAIHRQGGKDTQIDKVE